MAGAQREVSRLNPRVDPSSDDLIAYRLSVVMQ